MTADASAARLALELAGSDTAGAVASASAMFEVDACAVWSAVIDQASAGDGTSAAVVASSPTSPPWVFEELLARWGGAATTLTPLLAANPATPTSLLERLLSDGNRSVLFAAAQRPLDGLSDAALRHMIDIDDRTIDRALASNPTAPAKVLAELSVRSSQLSGTISILAKHPNTPRRVLRRLARTGRFVAIVPPVLRRYGYDVASNPAAGRRLLRRLARSRDEKVRAAATATLSSLPS